MNIIKYYITYHPLLAKLLRKLSGKIHYANGYVTLPPPLKAEEEQAYIRALDAGWLRTQKGPIWKRIPSNRLSSS